MNDFVKALEPKSDQINADDLLGGPKTIKITSMEIKPKTEQPITIHYEGEDGRPYKPCKSMGRVLMHVWGEDWSKYVGRSLTLYRDPEVVYGGQKVGGIRISHMSGIDKQVTLSLTASRMNKKPYTVKPLIVKENSNGGNNTNAGHAADNKPDAAGIPPAGVTEDKGAAEGPYKLATKDGVKGFATIKEWDEANRAVLGKLKNLDHFAVFLQLNGKYWDEVATEDEATAAALNNYMKVLQEKLQEKGTDDEKEQ